ncbi:MAG TPA: hypothetical protein DCW44_04500 [Eubacterium sp.]|nr:hypothetical protein [Eubacterium sp.]
MWFPFFVHFYLRICQSTFYSGLFIFFTRCGILELAVSMIFYGRYNSYL